ncbi:hypothetical protein AGDE_11450 [Angomonas deanei]|uniref:Uncharacterized protein n=1 Tax=Angomonas deanei TaxID=59799 RepID=A0A7G2C6V0_9TRYP|nr:hypothetical protein AGDE_11450 [Angomonas deanei]CAD2215456.1 hypothetical protein, conserved [Angomonas deanei]|eukprot:EPY26280.1 hypothetical protein AGDE_11450 [Angomonas deanei]
MRIAISVLATSYLILFCSFTVRMNYSPGLVCLYYYPSIDQRRDAMPSQSYTFEDFLTRLERSPVNHMSPLYHENKQLFIHRPDMFTKAVLSVQWEKGLALLQAAYYTQPIAAETYRGLLSRMLLHNKHVNRIGGGRLVSWQAAMSVFMEAVVAHGTTLPTKLHVSTLKLLAPHKQWLSAIQVLQLGQANEQLTKPMVVEAAASCACSAAWREGLQLLLHVHQQEPTLLSGAIESLRPPGTDVLSSADNGQTALLEGPSPGPTSEQLHLLKIVNEVVSATPWEVAMKHALCHSYLTHLIASTTLPPEEKTKLLTAALAQFPWDITLKLLCAYGEPELLDDEEWNRVQLLGPPKQKRGRKKKKSQKQLSATEEAAPEDALTEELHEGNMDLVLRSAETLRDKLQLLESSPETVSALVSVLAQKMPTVEMTLTLIEKSAAWTIRSPIVVQTILEKCAEEEEGWRPASNLLLQLSQHSVRLPAEVISKIVLQLRAARQTGILVQLLQRCIIPNQYKLTEAAHVAMFEAVLAHNKAYYTLQRANRLAGKDASCVHWLTALSCATDLQAPVIEDRVVATGTGESKGAISNRPEVVRRTVEKPLSDRVLALLIHICAAADSPHGALKAMGYARTVNKTELPCSDEIRALLYCAVYDRPYEAEAIVSKAREKLNEKESKSLEKLLETIREAKITKESSKERVE